MAKTQFTQTHPSLSPKRILATLVALGVAFLLLMSVINVAQKYTAARKRIRELSVEQQTLETKQAALVKLNAYLATPEGQEQALREKYNVIKPGEGMIVIANPESAAPPKHSSTVARWWKDILEGLGLHTQ